jgi:vacuolar-type H+-ATPase subunit I/STV1
MTDPTELEHLRDFRDNWHLLREKLEAQIKWLQKDNKELKATLEYAREELRKADRRGAEIAERARLTQEEREALHWFAHYGLPEHRAATLRGLLERLK